MALGIGQMLGGLMIGQMSGLLGEQKPEEQKQMQGGFSPIDRGQMSGGATHTMPDGTVMPGATHGGMTQQATNTQQQGFGGFGGMVSNISNQMFKGMSQEQVARLGQGFNSMTLRPDQGLHNAFQSTIDNATVVKGRKNAIAVLRKQGKNNIADMLETGGIDVKTAMSYALADVGKTDYKATLKILRSDPKNAQAMDLADILEANPSMNKEIMESYLSITGLDGNGDGAEYALGLSEIMTHQGKDDVDEEGRSREGQHYQIQTNKATGANTKVWLDSYGETLVQKDERIRLAKELERDETKAMEMGEAAQLEAQDYFSQVQMFEDALRYVDTEEEGALSGWLVTNLPSVNPNTSLLRGIQNKLGISVINSATFGALSEREMEMAMRTNIDLNLPPAELIVMIKEQIRVRRKLAMEFNDKALSLLTGDGKYSTFAVNMAKRQEKHNAVIWDKLNEAEIDSLLKAGIDKEKYKDKNYEWRAKWFDGRSN